MAGFTVQETALGSFRSPKLNGLGHCSRIWDPVNAHFEECVHPFILAIPAIVSVCTLVIILIKCLFRAFSFTASQWVRPFVEEPLEEREELHQKRLPMSVKTLFLMIFSVIGLSAQTFLVFYPKFHQEMVLPAASWAIIVLMLIISRPSVTPKSILIIISSIFISQVLGLSGNLPQQPFEKVSMLLIILSAIGAIVVILLMPLRDPRWKNDQISLAFEPSTSKLRSPEDNLTLWQFMTVSWMAPLISVGNSRQINDEDVWTLSYEFQHRHLHDQFKELHGSLWRRIFIANGMDLVRISLLAFVELFGGLSAPVLLQKILQSMENPRSPPKAVFTYAFIALLIRLIASQSGVFGLWYQRRAFERSRGELITMLYEKTLSRKVISISAKPVLEEDLDGSNGVGKDVAYSPARKVISYLMRPVRFLRGSYKVRKPADKSKDHATMGKILNLMRNDVWEISQRFWDFSMFITQPFGLILSIVLIWKLLGWACLIGVLTVFLAQAANALLSKVLLHWERERRTATDDKLHKISQLVDSIRHLRWYGWQDVWLARIMESRQNELRLRVITSIFRVLIGFTNTFSNGLFPVAAFYAYTIWANKPLTIDVAFPALQLFTMLESTLRELPNLITVILNARVSAGRIEDFMNEPDKPDADVGSSLTGDIVLKHASFAWPGADENILYDIDLTFQPGLTVIFGEVGAGKTALLQALLGELDIRGGEYHRVGEMIGYCAQTPWLQSMSIRENILFSAPYDEVRYRQVLEACALIPDMANFKDGDLSMIGENGIGLSGGQKARVALARAVYSRAKILLLDDPLSALDHQTAESIVRKCIAGPLLSGRTTILVTHRTELCLGLASQIVEIAHGQAKVLDPKSITSETLHRVRSSESLTGENNQRADEQANAAIPEKFIEEEHRAHGGVQAATYWEYIKAGTLKWWFILVLAMTLYRLVDIGQSYFLKQWGEAYSRPVELLLAGLFKSLPSPETNVRPWLILYLIIAIAQATAFLICQAFMLVIVYRAGKYLFEKVLVRVTHATFRFYDVTPVGRLMNRLTSDINTVDGNISTLFQIMALQFITFITSLIVIASVTPIFLIFAIGLSASFVVIFLHFIPTSQSLRRLEMVSLSPLLTNFGALTEGLTTIRAFCAQYRFQERVFDVTDTFQKMDHFYWSLQAWLSYRFDNLSACSTFILTAIALYTKVSPGLTAFVLTASNRFVIATHALCRVYGQLQMDFVSVERVVELLHLDVEPAGTIDPPASWPVLGSDIVFENVTIQYAPHLDPALSDVSVTIKGGSTTALIGRTGSGKSTMALSLLATNLPVSGRILIDNIDISKVNTQALRKRVTFLAQEPVLFPGTMRQNLDPLDEYTDEECEAVLSRIAERHQWTLNSHIDTGGRNLSQGQRQLVGLARALLRRSSIIIMDEATASIDMETALRIQEILREEMKESTVITIAHRVEAVSNADYCVVLGKGKVIEKGVPGSMVDLMQ
ncbi:ABC transporter-like protein [Xylogone sp. PMI_703]|nr:ABC transporter-like protein [Xylogone sp. PMI_703]